MIPLLAALLVVAAPGCARAPVEQQDARGHAEPGHDHARTPRQVQLRPEVVKEAGIVTAPVRRQVLQRVVNLPGEIQADPDRLAQVASPVAGRIATVHFSEGSAVKAGDLLAEVRIPELGTLRGELSSVRARARAARHRAEQLKALVRDGLAAEQAYHDAGAAAEALETSARALETQLWALGARGASGASLLPVRAPLAGVVIKRQAVTGQPVGKEEVLAVVADMSQVWFIGRVFEQDLRRVTVGSRAEVVLNAYPEGRLEGQVAYLGRQVDPVARTVTARIPLANSAGTLRLGLFGTARVASSGSRAGAPQLLVPRSALTELDKKTVAFVAGAPGHYRVHEVVVGEESLGQVEVLSGLREGEAVVVDGAFTLKSIILRSTLHDDHH